MDTKKLRQKILDLAIHGKLVPQDPNDEPASVLLERIRAEKDKLIKEGKIKAPKKSKFAGDTSHYPKEMPYEIPAGWMWLRGYDIYLPMESTSPQGEFFNYIDIDAIDNKHNVVTAPKHLPVRNAPSRATRLVRKGDVLFSMVRPYLRNIARVESDGYIASTGFYVCRCSNAIDSKYCYYLMLSDYVVEGLNQYMKGDNSPSINNNHITSWLYPIPPIAEQRRICESIDSMFSLVDSLGKEQALLHDTVGLCRNKILDMAIHGKLVPQDSIEEPAMELLKRINPAFKPSDNLHYKGDLPNGWCFCTIGDLFRHNTGKALNGKDQAGEELRYITTSNLYWDRFDMNEVRTMPFTEAEKEKCRATKGDLLVCEGGDIGRAAIWPYDYDVMIQNHIHRLRPRGDISVRFYYYIFLLYKQMGLIGGKGIAILGLSSRELDKMVIPVPPIPEQHRIVTIIERLFALMDALSSNFT